MLQKLTRKDAGVGSHLPHVQQHRTLLTHLCSFHKQEKEVGPSTAIYLALTWTSRKADELDDELTNG